MVEASPLNQPLPRGTSTVKQMRNLETMLQTDPKECNVKIDPFAWLIWG